ncbi:MAG: YqgE/AlgH family protein [Pseudomonadota bacterium]
MSDFETTSLKGQLLIAMPGMEDSRFQKTIIYICEHTPQGTMGIVLNRPLKNMSFIDVLQQVQVLDDEENVLLASAANAITVFRGGPVETGRGFVLHSSDYQIEKSTHKINDDVCMTETLEILKSLAKGTGPKFAFLALGYAGWAGGQLENEIQQNGWLHGPAPLEIVFNDDFDSKYEAALQNIGIDPALLSSTCGRA